MFEIQINGTTYPLRFGMGFLRDINKLFMVPIKEVPGKYREAGLNYYVGLIIDGDIEALAQVIILANKTEDPKINRNELDRWLENEDTDIDAVFDMVMDFFGRSNVTKKATRQVQENVEAQKEKMKD